VPPHKRRFVYEYKSLRIAKTAQIESIGTKFSRAGVVGAGRGRYVLFCHCHLAADAFCVAAFTRTWSWASPEKAFSGHLKPDTNVFTFADATLGILGDGVDLSRIDDKTYR
jgi:hypothetical protein